MERVKQLRFDCFRAMGVDIGSAEWRSEIVLHNNYIYKQVALKRNWIDNKKRSLLLNTQ